MDSSQTLISLLRQQGNRVASDTITQFGATLSRRVVGRSALRTRFGFLCALLAP